MRRVALEGELILEQKPGYIRVWHKRSARNADEADAVLASLEAAMEEWRVRRLLFDSRDADETPSEVGERIWSWMSAHVELERVATLVRSPDLADSVNVRGIENAFHIRSFHKEPAAVRWLTLLG
jgi:hypothetical protein